MQFVPHAVDFALGRVVSQEKLATAYNPPAESGSERHTEQVLVSFRTVAAAYALVDVGQKTGNGFTKCKKVAVVVDKYRNAEFFLKHGA
jgi:hypothetical protein